MSLSRVLGWTLLGSLIAAIVMSVSLASGVGSGFMFLIRADWLILIACLVFVFAFASLGCAKALEQARFPVLMQSGLTTALLSFMACLLLLLYGFRFSPTVSPQPVHSADTIEKRIEVDLTCPRCGVEQPIRTGSAKCTGCGLRIRIDVEEPRCECGYLLYQLEGDVCPECGRSIEDQDRWAKSTSRT